MRRRQLLVSAYLISVPLPYLCLQWLGIELEYENIGFWLVQIYCFPLWLISEPLGVPPIRVTMCIYGALVLPIVAAWDLLKRRSHPAKP